MNLENQKQALQNWADKFNCEIKIYQNFGDKRTKPKFILYKNENAVSNTHSYYEMNLFLLAIDRSKKFNL
jgi:hypothetical protein